MLNYSLALLHTERKINTMPRPNARRTLLPKMIEGNQHPPITLDSNERVIIIRATTTEAVTGRNTQDKTTWTLFIDRILCGAGYASASDGATILKQFGFGGDKEHLTRVLQSTAPEQLLIEKLKKGLPPAGASFYEKGFIQFQTVIINLIKQMPPDSPITRRVRGRFVTSSQVLAFRRMPVAPHQGGRRADEGDDT
jgi:hypothetical protein